MYLRTFAYPEMEMYQVPRNQPADDDFDDDDETTADAEGSEAIKNMRKRIRELEKETTSANSAKRELAMVKAGVDTDSKLGQLFLKSYEGDLTVDAIKAEAVDLGILAKPTDTTTEDETVETDTSDTADRRTLANGALPSDAGREVDTKATAMDAATAAMGKGLSFDKAAGGFIAKLAEAAMGGDQSVIVS